MCRHGSLFTYLPTLNEVPWRTSLFFGDELIELPYYYNLIQQCYLKNKPNTTGHSIPYGCILYIIYYTDIIEVSRYTVIFYGAA